MNRIIVFFAILILSGCAKSPHQQEYNPGPLYAIPGEMKAWTIFKPGSYWLYKNETTSQTDSSTYKYGPYYREVPCGNCPVVQYNWFFVNSPVFVKFDILGRADSNAVLKLTTRNRWETNILTANTLVHPDASSNDSDYSSTYKCLGLYDSLVLNGVTFSNVIGTRVESRNYKSNIFFVESWFARNIGLVKFRKHTSDGDTTWSLVGWHTVQ